MLFNSGETSTEDARNSANQKCIMELLTRLKQQTSETTTLQSNDLCPTPLPAAPTSHRQITERVSLSHLELHYCFLKSGQLLLFEIRTLLLRKWAMCWSIESGVSAKEKCVCACVCIYMHVHHSLHSGHVQAETKSLFLLYLQGHI